MCEVSEKIGRMYEQNGMIKGKRKTAINLARMGMPEEKIAEAVEMKVKVVRGWLKSEKTLS